MTPPTTPVLPAAGAPFDLDATLSSATRCAEELRASQTVDDAAAALLRWDGVMAEQQTWSSSQSIRFRQDTSDETTRAAKERLDESAGDLAETRRVVLAALESLGEGIRAGLVERFGAAVLERWRCELRTFDPSVSEALTAEQRVQSEAMTTTGSARVSFRGEEQTLPAVGAFLTSPDRAVRREAAVARWGWFDAHAKELDDQFARLVEIRHGIAESLGYRTFTGLGYDRMRRADFTPQDVADFRAAVEEHVVPVAARIRERQAKALGLDAVAVYDENVWCLDPSPSPEGDAEWLEARAAEMFAEVDAKAGTRLGELFGAMQRSELLDLKARDGKGAGGFCSFLPSLGVPFIFANFNGTAGDVRVFTHEMGHAYQGWCSHGNVALTDQRRCTSETAEIHSMSLEFLTWPWMDRFFGEAAGRFRAEHLAQQLTFLPYGCSIDHFQHEAYAHPEMSVRARHLVWQEIEGRYLPWRDWDGVPHGSRGAAWQAQLHVYQYPLYYIDYVLAAFVALQFLGLSRRDPAAAWKSYQRLCELGGKLGFRELVEEAGLRDPFDPKVVEDVTRESAAILDSVWA
ncbi:MAG: M3 family oligoendopeptidase [Planctomycetota bacterium]